MRSRTPWKGCRGSIWPPTRDQMGRKLWLVPGQLVECACRMETGTDSPVSSDVSRPCRVWGPTRDQMGRKLWLVPGQLVECACRMETGTDSPVSSDVSRPCRVWGPRALAYPMLPLVDPSAATSISVVSNPG